ncbi:MAG: TIM barrel protein [bacterium]|nr:TIM barrel protein [bacterium]
MNRRSFVHSAASAAAVTMLAGRPAAAQSKAKIKKAVGVGMLPDSLSLEDRFKLAAGVGFDGVEGATTEDPKQVEAIRSAAEKAGIRLHSVMNSNHWQFPLSSPKADDVKKGIEGMRTSLQNAHDWGADTVLLVPAVVNPQVRYVEAYERSQKHIREDLLPLAKELGVVIAVEEVWNKFLLSPIEFAKYVDEFDSPYLKAYFDVGNVVLYGYPQDWIRTLGKRIAKLHVKGFKRVDSGWQWTNVLDGDIDWKDVRKALDEIGYEGFMTAEVSGGDEAYLRDLSKRMDSIIAGTA